MKIKTSDLTGAALDWAVAKARGFDVYHSEMLNGHIKHGFWVSGYHPGDLNIWVPLSKLASSTDWSQGGPIIEREGITPGPYHGPDGKVIEGCYQAYIGWDPVEYESLFQVDGPTPLIAAMRCFVASKLGEIVDVPDELI